MRKIKQIRGQAAGQLFQRQILHLNGELAQTRGKQRQNVHGEIRFTGNEINKFFPIEKQKVRFGERSGIGWKRLS